MNNYLTSTGWKRGVWEALNGSSERWGKSIRNPHLLQDAVSICLYLKMRHFFGIKIHVDFELKHQNIDLNLKNLYMQHQALFILQNTFSNWQNTVFEGSLNLKDCKELIFLRLKDILPCPQAFSQILRSFLWRTPMICFSQYVYGRQSLLYISLTDISSHWTPFSRICLWQPYIHANAGLRAFLSSSHFFVLCDVDALEALQSRRTTPRALEKVWERGTNTEQKNACVALKMRRTVLKASVRKQRRCGTIVRVILSVRRTDEKCVNNCIASRGNARLFLH